MLGVAVLLFVCCGLVFCVAACYYLLLYGLRLLLFGVYCCIVWCCFLVVCRLLCFAACCLLFVFCCVLCGGSLVASVLDKNINAFVYEICLIGRVVCVWILKASKEN